MIKTALLTIALSLLPVLPSELPNGDIDLTEQVVVEYQLGYRLKGQGRVDNHLESRGRYSRINWKGDGDVAFRLGSRGFLIENLTIVGGNVHIPALEGFGTGNGEFRNVGFIDSTVIAGTPGINGNADQVTFYRCWFRNVIRDRDEPAFRNTTSQNILYKYELCTFKNFEQVLDILGGGHVSMVDCYINECDVIINIDRTAIGEVLGSQNSQFVLERVRWDQKQKAYPTIVRDQAWYGIRSLRLRDCHFYAGQFKLSKHGRGFMMVRGPWVSWDIEQSGNSHIPNGVLEQAGFE